MTLPHLPIDDVLPQIIAALRSASSLVVRAPTGAGKTTRIAPALLDAGLAGSKQIVLLQPRRVAARAAAARMSAERGKPLGDEIGYHVRFESRSGRQTRILVATEGVFLRWLQDDPFIERVAIVIFDEFHERNLNTDLALAMLRRVQQTVRPDVRIVVMSATLDAAPIAQYLNNCPQIDSAGRLFPVETRYVPHESREHLSTQVAQGVRELFATTSGDILAFLPGVGEIRRAAEQLADWAQAQDVLVTELFADLPLERQQAVLVRGQRRKVVLSTNVAETSVTIEGVTGVVDCGWVRQLRYDAQLGLDHLELIRISRASAEQRAGRAGRTAPGVALRLWTVNQQRGLRELDAPEIERVDLAGPVLELLAWGENDPLALDWFTPPSAERVQLALRLLARLSAVEHGKISALGKLMSRFPLHPRLSRLLIEGARHGQLDAAAATAALLEERDLLRRAERSGPRIATHSSDSDVLDRLHALDEFERTSRRETELGTIDATTARQVLRSRDRLLQLWRGEQLEPSGAPLTLDEAVCRAVWTAFPDRLVRRREPGSPRGLMIGGRGVKLIENSAVHQAEFFVAVEADDRGASESLVRQASLVERAWLDELPLQTRVEVEFDADRGRVVAWRRTCLDDLVIDEAQIGVKPSPAVAALLSREAATRLDLATCFDPDELNYLARVRCLAQWMPDLQLPDLETDTWGQLLPVLCATCVSLDDVRRASLRVAVQQLLTPQQIQQVEREAPERITVPSGSAVRLQYERNKPPVLAVRIQEVFGMLRTPRVAGGRVSVLMHLLAPNMRPQQVTQDLASFWQNTYGEVRKELKRRYPKHAWPDDPTTAVAQHRPGKPKL